MKIEPSEVLTLADLDRWSFAGTALAVLGQPIKHSISPAMHNAALLRMAETDPRFAEWRYFRFEISPEDLPVALTRFHARRFRGLNLTVPHKVIAFDQIAQVDPTAKPVGAVNTLKWTSTGWQGFNTDGHGLAAGVQADLGLKLEGAKVILLGAGGAARGAAVECVQRRCAELWIANRTQARRDELLALLAPLSSSTRVRGFEPGKPPADLPAGALVVNATSAGLRSEDPLPVDLALLPSPAGVYDMIYNPPETKLLARARELGLPAANGLSMLVHQGARALAHWTERTVPVEVMATAARAALA